MSISIDRYIESRTRFPPNSVSVLHRFYGARGLTGFMDPSQDPFLRLLTLVRRSPL